MRRRRSAIALPALGLLALAGPACTDDDDPPASAADCPADLAEPLEAWGDAGFSGVVAVATDGAFDCRYATGAHTEDTAFRIGSVSKAFAAAAVLDLVDADAIALDDRAGDLVPGLGGPVADATVEQLLSHTSGLLGTHAEDDDPIGHDEAVAAIGAMELSFPPGTDYLYSNAGYTLLAMIVEATSGATYQDFVRDAVLLDGAGEFTTSHWATAGNGDLAMSVPQLADWTHALFHGPRAERIRTTGFDHGDGTRDTAGWLAFEDEPFGMPFFATAGGGGDGDHNAAVAYLPDTDRVIAMASDTEAVRAEDLLLAIGPALATGEPIPLPSDGLAGDVDPEALAELAGEYDGGYAVSVDDDGLRIEATTPDAVAALFPRPDGADEHEEAVLATLRGETRPGRDELALLEEDLGEIVGVAVVGTVEAEGEIRTYVTLTTADGGTQAAWYALDDGGGIAGVELTDGGPALRFVPAAGGRFVPDDPTGTGPDVTVTFDGDDLVVLGD